MNSASSRSPGRLRQGPARRNLARDWQRWRVQRREVVDSFEVSADYIAITIPTAGDAEQHTDEKDARYTMSTLQR